MTAGPPCSWGDPRIDERAWSAIYPEPNTGCWLWGKSENGTGYGCIWRKHDGVKRQYVVHRYVYLMLVGPIPDGLQLDHLCRQRACCRPDHLEPVTQQVNIARGEVGTTRRRLMLARTTCGAGHELTQENSYSPPGKPFWRQCKTCDKEEQRVKRVSRPGYKGPRAKLSDDDVAHIFVAGYGEAAIAEAFGVSLLTVQRIRRGVRRASALRKAGLL